MKPKFELRPAGEYSTGIELILFPQGLAVKISAPITKAVADESQDFVLNLDENDRLSRIEIFQRLDEIERGSVEIQTAEQQDLCPYFVHGQAWADTNLVESKTFDAKKQLLEVRLSGRVAQVSVKLNPGLQLEFSDEGELVRILLHLGKMDAYTFL